MKRINGGPALVWLFSVLSLILYLPAAIAVIVLDDPSFDTNQWIFIAGSTMLHLAYFLLLQRGYRVGDLSLVYPTARATGPFLATVFAVLVLDAHLTLQIAAGGLAIVVGVLLLTGGFRRGQREVTISLGFGLLVGTLIASYTVWDAHTVSTLAVSPLLLDYASTFGRTVLLAPVALRHRREVVGYWREHRMAVFGVAVLSPLAYILVLYALTFTSVVYVAPTRELSVLMVVLLGSLVLKEGHLRRRLGWAVLILAGVVLLATG